MLKKITGEFYENFDRVRKSTATKNTIKETITRTRVRTYMLECGHSIAAASCSGDKIPKRKKCHECTYPDIFIEDD